MRPLQFPVRHWQFTVILFALVVMLGAASWHLIPRGEDPPIELPFVTVIAAYPGASPTDLERLVVKQVEERLDALDNVETIRTSILDGVATVQVRFEVGEDPEERFAEVVREMNALRPSLPADLARFSIERYTTLDVAIIQLALVSEAAPYHVLDSIAERLEDRLTALPGVRTAERWGVPARQVDVALDLGRLSRLNLPVGHVLQAIAGESADIPAGRVEAGLRAYNVKSSGSYEALEEVGATVVRANAGHLIRVRDVADVRWGYQDSTYRAFYNGQRAVFVTVTQQEGQSIGAVQGRVWRVLDTLETELPHGVKLERGFDQSRNVSHRLSRLGKDFVIAIALVAITLLPLGLRAAGIVMVSIPLSLAIGLTLLRLTGFTVNQLSIVGAVIALGLLVDDSIVVVENIARFLREGWSRAEAAVAATSQIALAVLGATATLILAFLPLLLLPGGPGEYIRSLPVTVVFTILGSLLVSLTIVPWLASRVLRPEGPGGNRVLQLFERVIHATYAPVLDRALRWPRRTLLIAVASLVPLALLPPVIGFSLFPKAETPQFYVSVTAPEGASIAATVAATRYADSVLRSRQEVQAVFASAGRDNPLIYYNLIPRRESPSVGQLFVTLDRFDPRRTPPLLDSLRTVLAAYPFAKLELRQFENGPPLDAPIALRVHGPDLDTLRTIAADVERILETTPGTQYVHNPVRLRRTDLRVAIDRGKAGLLGIPTLEIDRTIRLGLAGVPVGVVREADGDARDVVVRLAGAPRPSPAALDQLFVTSLAGRLVPLRQVADVRFEAAVPEIRRVDRERTATVTSFVQTGYNTDRVTRRALVAVDSLHLPPGYRVVPAGEIESRHESFGGIGSAVIAAIFSILAVLVLEFKTFRGTLIVASVIPLGVVGGLLALLLTGYDLSFNAMIGFVALIGIEIKTSILLVDYTNQLRLGGMRLDDAIRRAGEVRFLPIALTSLTAIGGLLPLALQGEMLYAPLAWVIIGGLVSSTLLARVVTPVLYKLWPPALAG